jgi:hypothetical protein
MISAAEAKKKVNLSIAREKAAEEKRRKEEEVAEKRFLKQAKEVDFPIFLADLEKRIENTAYNRNRSLEVPLGSDRKGRLFGELITPIMELAGYKFEITSEYYPEVTGRRAYDEYDWPATTVYTLTISWYKG